MNIEIAAMTKYGVRQETSIVVLFSSVPESSTLTGAEEELLAGTSIVKICLVVQGTGIVDRLLSSRSCVLYSSIREDILRRLRSQNIIQHFDNRRVSYCNDVEQTAQRCRKHHMFPRPTSSSCQSGVAKEQLPQLTRSGGGSI